MMQNIPLFDFESAGSSVSSDEYSIISFWTEMLENARTISEKESYLKDYFHNTIIKHQNFSSALSFLLASQFHSKCVEISFEYWLDILTPILYNNETYDEKYGGILKLVIADIRGILERDPAASDLIHCFLYFKGYKALLTHRVAHIFYKNDKKQLAYLLQSLCSDLFAVDIHPGAIIGPGLMLDHATGVVIGETCEIGSNCSFLHGVTLGSTGKVQGKRHPTIGDDVLIGCNATILGNISVGYSAKIGSGSIVLKSIPAMCTAVGNPARIVGKSSAEVSSAMSMDYALDDVRTPSGELFSQTYTLWADGNRHLLDDIDIVKDANGQVHVEVIKSEWIKKKYNIMYPEIDLDEIIQVTTSRSAGTSASNSLVNVNLLEIDICNKLKTVAMEKFVYDI